MSVQVEKLEKNMAKLTVEVPAEEVEKALQAAYMKEKNKISIPGFRKGKVPRAMIEKMYGAAVFYEEAANILIQDNYAAAMEESKEDIVSRPTIDIVQIESGKPFIFTAEVAVRPEVTLGKYKGVQVTKIDTTVTDEEVEAALEKEQQKNSRTVTVTDRPVANGDTAVIDFEGFVDGIAFEGGKGENHPLEIGSRSFIDTFEDQLVGHNAGDEVEVNVTFPEKYQAADLAGKPAVFKVKINEIKAKELPELNDEFASEVSEFDTLAEYKEDLRKHRNILSIKGGGYKPTRTLLLELDAEFNQFLLKTEEVVCEGLILPTSLYENTRGYIETLGKQINASYEHNIYDGCSVLMRRLLEILLIHSYEATGNITVIQDGDGYKNLSVIINDIIQHKRFSLSKEVLSVLDRFRMLGNLSAHKIQYNAKKAYIDEVITLYRVAIEELLYISKIKA